MSSEPLTLIDLRAESLRQAQPLEGRTSWPVRVLSLEAIEEGQHCLSPADGPLLVLCERGVRSGLAARYLRADGLQADHWSGRVEEWLAQQEGGGGGPDVFS